MNEPRKNLPLRVNNAVLASYFQPGEPAVVVKLVGVGSTAPFELRGSGAMPRSFILEWNSRADGHVVRIPLSHWMANDARLAHELMEHRRMAHAMVVTFEAPAAVTTPAAVPAAAGTETGTRPGTAKGAADSGQTLHASGAPTPSSTFSSLSQTGAAETDETASIVVVRGRGTRSAAPTSPPSHGAGGSPAPAPAPTNESVIAGDATPLLGGRPLHEVAHERLARPQRLLALATLLKVDAATLREAAGAREARIEIAGAWVRRRVEASA